jgi:catechol 2,3-dioxygenase-like lactoylglutathione lyase family enzyme
LTLDLLGSPASTQIHLGSAAQQLLSLELKTNKFDDARRFYLDVVGLKELPGSNAATRPKRTTSLSFGGTYAESFIMITQDGADGTAPVAAGVLQRLVFKVTDAKAAFERARAAGASLVREPSSAHGNPGLIVALVRDPDGNMVEFVQPPAL